MNKISRRRFLTMGVVLGVGALLTGYSVLIENRFLRVNYYKIPVPNLPASFENFQILQLTDLHHGGASSLEFIRQVVEKANGLEKNITVCTGDYVKRGIGESRINGERYIKPVWSELEKLYAPQGVYSVLGNHDHWESTEVSLECLEKSGQNIRHKAVEIKIGKERIWLGGAGDLWEDALGVDRAFADVEEADCKILLAHNPDSADAWFKTRVDLMISGHTHGGQVRVPFIGAPILPVQNKRYDSGFIKSDRVNLFISKGVGWVGIPVRFNCPPEIAILVLTSDNSEFEQI